MAAPMGDTPCQSKTEIADHFKVDFKYYKSRKPPPDLVDVIDFGNNDDKEIFISQLQPSPGIPQLSCLKPVEEWNVSRHTMFPGFTFIRNPFRDEYQSYWIKRCLEDYPLKPNVSNLDAHMEIEANFSIWNESIRQRKNTNLFTKTLMHKLRWVTLGYHHDWNTKKYSSENVTPMARDMRILSQYISTCLGWSYYKAEAAIVNYYHLDSTLAGHTDHSELDHQSPLLSISFGQTALFMLGGPTKETKPMTMYLRSGDVAIMEGPARLSYHAIPKILPDSCDVSQYVVNLKRPFETTRSAESDRRCTGRSDFSKDIEDLNKDIDEILIGLEVADFWDYLRTSRINMNIRQVLPEGQAFPVESKIDGQPEKSEELT